MHTVLAIKENIYLYQDDAEISTGSVQVSVEVWVWWKDKDKVKCSATTKRRVRCKCALVNSMDLISNILAAVLNIQIYKTYQ